MPILPNDVILEQFKTRKRRFAEWRLSSGWLHNEVKESFAVYEGETHLEALWGWQEENALTKRQNDHKPCIAINKAAPVLDAISGFHRQNLTEVDYSPRSMESDPKADVVNAGLKYIKTESSADFENSVTFDDMLKCGVGAIDSWISYDDKAFGSVQKERIAPHLMGWDISARKRNFIDRNWNFKGVLVDKDEFLSDVNEELEEQGKPKLASIPFEEDEFIKYFNRLGNDNLAIAYQYEWRVKEPKYQVENAFLLFPQIAAELATQDPEILTAFAKKFKCDIAEDKYIWVDDKKDIIAIYKACGIEPVKDNIKQYKIIKHKTYKYYRARITGDMLISADDNFSQTGFAMKFKTGKWSETRQCPYGVMRAAKDPQRLLNRSVSDLAWHIEANPYGGIFIEPGAVPNGDMDAFKETYLKSAEATFVADGAIAGNKILPKNGSQLPQSIPAMIQLASDTIMQVMGVPVEFMGMGDSGSNDYDVFSKRVKQCLMTLANYFDAEHQSSLEQARLDIDMLRVLSDNTGGLLIKNISGITDENGKKTDYMTLLPDDIAMEYDMIAREVPKSESEKQDMLKMLLDLAQVLAPIQPEAAGALAPFIIDNLDMPSKNVDEIQEALAPKPQQPDPVNQALLQSQTALNSAQAEKISADAKQVNIIMLEKVQELGRKNMVDEQARADIEKTLADAALSRSKAHDVTHGGTAMLNTAKAHDMTHGHGAAMNHAAAHNLAAQALNTHQQTITGGNNNV